MMKKIALDTFMDYRMLSSLTLSPDGEKLAYVLTGIDREKKEYVSRLRLRAGEDDRLMVSDGKIGEFFFEERARPPFCIGSRSPAARRRRLTSFQLTPGASSGCRTGIC